LPRSIKQCLTKGFEIILAELRLLYTDTIGESQAEVMAILNCQGNQIKEIGASVAVRLKEVLEKSKNAKLLIEMLVCEGPSHLQPLLPSYP
jgi:hypothetical protein